MQATVLVVDAQEPTRRTLASALERAGFRVMQAEDGNAAWARFRAAEPDVVVTELRVPGCDGPALLQRIRRESSVPVIFKSLDASTADVVGVLKAGASDFVSSREPDALAIVRSVAAARESGASPGDSGLEAELGARLVGPGPRMRRVRARLAGLAPLDTPVLILGEPGTGRDTAVTALHEIGATRTGTMRRIDCARFDVRVGVPTCSAVYLDGVEALTPAMQAYWGKHLAEFESRGYSGVPRVLASAAMGFGQPTAPACDPRLRDILLRFAVTLPPLRDRSGDVPSVANALVARQASKMDRSARLDAGAHAFLGEQRWHDNVRELEQLLERAVAFSGGGVVGREVLAELVGDYEASVESIRSRFEEHERIELLSALRACGGNISRASMDLGKSRGAVYRLIEKHGIPLRSRR
jgi:DNA-binding NtrC family response regulator